MRTLTILRALVRENLTEWQHLDFVDLRFWHRNETQLMLTAFVGLSALMLLARLAIRRRPERRFVTLPALLSAVPRGNTRWAAWIVHVPTLLCLAGLLFLAVALADPYTPLVSRQMSYPGRRITLAIDASASM
jgi:hypothetical protein